MSASRPLIQFYLRLAQDLICYSSSARRIEESLRLSVHGQHQTVEASSEMLEVTSPRHIGNIVVVHQDGTPIARCDGHEASLWKGAPNSGEQSDTLVEAGLKPQSPRCAAWCSCICHTSNSFRSPYSFKPLIGEICLEYSTQQARCNEISCRRHDISTFNLVYRLPRFLMFRYIAISMRYAPLDGPHFSLRMPRVTPWTHLLWNYAMVGNLVAIHKMFAEGRASPYDVNIHGSNALTYALSHNRPKIVRFLLEQGADAELSNAVGRTPVDIYWEMVFAGRSVNIGVGNHWSLFEDSDYVQTRQLTILHKIVLGLVSRDLKAELELSTADINAKDGGGRTPLVWATIRVDESAVRTLLAFGADPNITDMYGCTPLHFVTSAGVCKLLLDAKIKVNARNAYYDRTALHTNNRDREVGVIDMLIQAGIDVNAQDADGETALLNATYNIATQVALRLLELGADVNATNRSSGISALHYATEYNRHEILADLLNRGADYSKRTETGRTILHLAAYYSGNETLSILSGFNLEGLDKDLCDQNGKTAADYLSERCILVDIDESMRDKFHALLQTGGSPCMDTVGSSRSQLQMDHARADSELESEQHQLLHVPGAFPNIDEAQC